MRSLLMVCAVVCLALVAGVANAAPGQVPDATLAAFGLSGMQQMSDVQGTQVRGMGFAAVGGIGTARAPGGQVETTWYGAVSNPHHGSALAAGANVAVAASGVGIFTPIGNVGVVVGGIAVGGSVAYAR
jgi:hypothetical protein